ncbi:putative nuclease HARBI1 [Dermacentor albipictus]|uniref:putative nuclease HARBI1 n=1 Tax=Dermacentor albipictus TaxID=60249 RepID=UPI0038FD21C2
MYSIARRRRRRRRRVWVRQVFIDRAVDGDFHNLFAKLRVGDAAMFHNFMRMSPQQFRFLENLVRPLIEVRSTHLRPSISSAERLAITTRFLATGNSYQSLSYSFRVGKSTVSTLVPKVCQALWTVLQPRFLKPLNEQSIKAIAEEFYWKWNFPNCAGAIDGKHIHLGAPPNSGSLYFNYKQGFSVNLMASCDASYKFTSVYIGCYGRESDGGVFAASELGKFVDNGHQNLPAPCALPNGGPVLPYVFVADDAFPLKTNLMKPYPGMQVANSAKRIYNYRLSRARRCIENAFGVMCARWRVLRNRMSLLPDNAVLAVAACCCLHNFLMQEGRQAGGYCPPQFADTNGSSGELISGDWRNSTPPLPQACRQGSNTYSRNAADVRDSFASYFHGRGAVPWQFT